MTSDAFLKNNATDLVDRIPVNVKRYSLSLVFVLAFAGLLLVGFFVAEPIPYGWLFFIGGGLLSLGGLYVLSTYIVFRDKFALVIDEHGIHERFITGPRSILWEDIETIGIFRTAQGEAVAFRCKSRTFGRVFTGGKYDVWLSNNYSIDNNQLLDVLRSWQSLNDTERRQ